MTSNGVFQLTKLTIRYCKSDAGSKGMRDFIKGPLIDFARVNPHLQIKLQVQPGRVPRFTGEYVDKSVKEIQVHNKTMDDVAAVANKLRDSATAILKHYNKPVVTSVPTIQGVWDPSVTYEGFQLREGKIPTVTSSSSSSTPVSDSNRTVTAASAGQ